MIKVLIFILAVFLLFFRLDSPMLWQDEGEVAMVARNITKYGLPVTYDGNFLITQTDGQDSRFFGNSRLWTWNTWLPYYAAAVSFKIFGESTAAARLPFVIGGIATLFISYFLAKKMKLSPEICLLVLATNTVFYLYSRQSRYYAFSMLFPLTAMYFYFSKKYFLYFLSLLASFHSNFVLAFGFNLPLIILSLKNKYTWLFITQSVLWLWYFHPAATGGQFGFIRYWDGLKNVFEKIVSYLNVINSFYFPLIFIPVIIFFKRFNPTLKILIIGTLFHILVISFFLQFGQRYLITLIPIFSLLIGGILSSFRNKKIVFLIIPVIIFTNIFNIFSERVFHPSFLFSPVEIKSYFVDYVSSLGKNYPGPIEGAVKYLKDQNLPNNSLVYTDYEVNDLKFYLPDIKFVDHFTTEAKYFIPRKNWGYLNEFTPCQKQLLEASGRKITLDYYDTQWETMPDITYHNFTIDPKTPRLVVYVNNNAINWKQCD